MLTTYRHSGEATIPRRKSVSLDRFIEPLRMGFAGMGGAA
jgi:hypothetical protein